MAEAICIRCGTAKSEPALRCKKCGFDPSGSEDAIVESVYFSTLRFFGDAEAEEAYRETLEQYSRQIAAGDKPAVDEAELSRLRAHKAEFEAGRYPPGRIVLGMLRVFAPAILFLAILFTIVFALGRLVGRH